MPQFRPDGDTPDGAKMLHETAMMHGIAVTEVGRGKPWTNHYECKILGVWEEIRGLRGYDYIIFADADDCLFATGLGEMHHWFDKIGKDFVACGEAYCWPWIEKYSNENDGFGRLRYLNSGFFMATWPAFLRVWRGVMKQEDDGYQERGRTIKNDDQAAFFRYWVENPGMIELDSSARLCLCLAGLDGRWALNHDIEWGKRPFCHLTKTAPCVLHFNGKEKWRMRDAFDLLCR